MEALLTALSGIVVLFTENFWILVLIIAFLCSKSNRLAGLLIITMMIYRGYHPITFGIIIFLSICTDFLNPAMYFQKEYKRKLDELERELNSNVIKMHSRE